MSKENKYPAVEVAEGVRLRRLDRYNIVVEQLTEGISTKTGETTLNWQLRGYYSDMRKAVKSILNNDLLIDPYAVKTLEDYYVQLQAQVAKLEQLVEG